MVYDRLLIVVSQHQASHFVINCDVCDSLPGGNQQESSCISFIVDQEIIVNHVMLCINCIHWLAILSPHTRVFSFELQYLTEQRYYSIIASLSLYVAHAAFSAISTSIVKCSWRPDVRSQPAAFYPV